jgi:hypothetical protein
VNKEVFGFEIKRKQAADLADQAEPKGGFRPFGLRVPWELQRKILKKKVLS